MDILKWLEKWFFSMCDGSWEHFYGVKIDTLDNPGWRVLIDIIDTPLEGKDFETISRYVDEGNWIHCQIKDGKFDGGGDPSKLTEILYIFKDWVEDVCNNVEVLWKEIINMNYDELVSTALERKELKKLLCGEKPYEVEMSEFTSDVFPTDVNAVLMNCIYKQFYHIENIREIFEDCLCEMLNEDEVHVYIACLYFDTCLFQEEQNKAPFNIDKVMWASRIKNAVKRTRVELEHEIYFANGMKKSNPLKNIQNFNKYYQKKYGIEII